jgi:hypothetical protein
MPHPVTVVTLFGSYDDRDGEVTGQVNFDSHTSGVVTKTVEAVNTLTPGHAQGREYPTPDLREFDPTANLDDLRELSTYALDLRAVFEAVDAGDIDAACTRVNTLLRETNAAPVLIRHDDEPWHLHFHAPGVSWARGWVAPMATALAVVLGNPVHDRLGVCTAPACDRVYVDVSRNGTKRFCSTACQNRVKAATFRARHRP